MPGRVSVEQQRQRERRSRLCEREQRVIELELEQRFAPCKHSKIFIDNRINGIPVRVAG